nr:GatB/YqeY domain-containing protein [Bacilli bacterium]
MGVYNRLSDDLVKAMRDKDKIRLSVLRMVKAAVRNQEIDSHKTLTDEEVLSVFRKEVKQRRDTLASVAGKDRSDIVEEVKAELAILEEYLPVALTEAQIEEIVVKVVQEVGATSKADMGKVMPLVMANVAGRAEGKVINTIVMRTLSAL